MSETEQTIVFTDKLNGEITLAIAKGYSVPLLIMQHGDEGNFILCPETVKEMLPYLIKFAETGKII